MQEREILESVMKQPWATALNISCAKLENEWNLQHIGFI